MASLMNKAGANAPSGKAFTPPDVAKAVPSEMKDTVDRIVAAGMRIMYSEEMSDERMQAVQSQDPIPKRLAENVTGLMLTLDQQTKGGLPAEALFPAAMMLMSEAANLLQQAGQEVSEEDYRDGAYALFVLIGKKLGGTDEQIMDAAAKAVPGGEPADDEGPADPMPEEVPEEAPMPGMPPEQDEVPQ